MTLLKLIRSGSSKRPLVPKRLPPSDHLESPSCLNVGISFFLSSSAFLSWDYQEIDQEKKIPFRFVNTVVVAG